MNGNNQNSNIFSANDALDINELAALNDDISPEFIEQLQNRLQKNVTEFTGKTTEYEKEDSELFEELNQQETVSNTPQVETKVELEEINTASVETNEEQNLENQKTLEAEPVTSIEPTVTSEIENLTNGNIVEKPFNKTDLDYNNSLDYLDENVKYSKYVIYVDPENKDFIDSLTVKERKNLINRILREQDDIALTKRRLSVIQTVIKHVIIAIITITISVPIIYWAVNASLEASINNYRRSQTIFKTLYREKGKIKTQNNY